MRTRHTHTVSNDGEFISCEFGPSRCSSAYEEMMAKIPPEPTTTFDKLVMGFGLLNLLAVLPVIALTPLYGPTPQWVLWVGGEFVVFFVAAMIWVVKTERARRRHYRAWEEKVLKGES